MVRRPKGVPVGGVGGGKGVPRECPWGGGKGVPRECPWGGR